MTVDNVVCVEHPFGAHDMFAKQEETMKETFTVEVFAWGAGAGDSKEVFNGVDDAKVEQGFLQIIQGDRLTSINVSDIIRTVAYPS